MVVTSTAQGGEAALWEAVAEQATAWADLPVVRRFAEQLPRNASQRSRGLPGLLQHLTASGGMVDSRPLRLGTDVPQMLSVVGSGAPAVRTAILNQWLEDAVRVEGAHRVTVAWLRSRLPRYPQLPAPQLARGTPLTTGEFTYRLPWTREELAAGFQFQNPPSEQLETLGATQEHAARADEAARRLALALAETAQWQRLRAIDAALSPGDRAELAAARKAVADASTPAAVDAHEANLAIPRDAYRQQVVDDVVGTLTGPAREYADAFDAADQIVELAGSEVFGQLAVYGAVALVGVTELTAHGAGPGTVEFTVEDVAHADPGTVCWLDDPLLPDAVHLTRLSYRFDQAAGPRTRATGRMLLGTAAVWPRLAP